MRSYGRAGSPDEDAPAVGSRRRNREGDAESLINSLVRSNVRDLERLCKP